MAKKIFTYRGLKVEELKKLDVKEFAKLLPARQRRTLERGFTDTQRSVLAKVDRANNGTYKKNIKTHARDLIVLPNMVGLTLHIYNGKKFVAKIIDPEMVGLFLGELAPTRNNVKHSSPGVGATKSSSSASVK
jgi:small subunit ribosomal protein S19